LADKLKTLFFKLLSDLDSQAAAYINEIITNKITLSQIFAALTEKAKQEIQALVNQTISSLSVPVGVCLF
jgi:hypothetical protein